MVPLRVSLYQEQLLVKPDWRKQYWQRVFTPGSGKCIFVYEIVGDLKFLLFFFFF